MSGKKKFIFSFLLFAMIFLVCAAAAEITLRSATQLLDVTKKRMKSSQPVVHCSCPAPAICFQVFKESRECFIFHIFNSQLFRRNVIYITTEAKKKKGHPGIKWVTTTCSVERRNAQ